MFSGKRLKIKMLEFSSIMFLIPIVAVIYSGIAVEKYQFIGGGRVFARWEPQQPGFWYCFFLRCWSKGWYSTWRKKKGKFKEKYVSLTSSKTCQNYPLIGNWLLTYLLLWVKVRWCKPVTSVKSLFNETIYRQRGWRESTKNVKIQKSWRWTTADGWKR